MKFYFILILLWLLGSSISYEIMSDKTFDTDILPIWFIAVFALLILFLI